MRVGIDIGGAFTDLVAYDDQTRDLHWVKVESTPQNLSEGVMECVKRSGIPRGDFEIVIHGQTVVINTIIERKGSKVGLITTKGHRDILELQRGNRRDMYNFKYRKPEPLVPRFLRLEVDERMMADGTILKELDVDQVSEALKKLMKNGVETICVAFLNSYANPIHEMRVRDVSKETVEIPVVLSYEVTREWREYERFNTAVLNAYVLPIIDRYLDALQSVLAENPRNNMAMTSEGGMVTFDFAKKYPIQTIESGPVAGVIGAVGLAELIGECNIITLDGGSTTTKASLIEELSPKVTTEYYIERDRFRPGFPVMVPVVRTVEIGNGGTSIAWIDEVGRVRVGPKAAGADPGPACYGKGGKEPTLTDAYVVAGLLNPDYLLGGELKINRVLAVNSLKNLASRLGRDVDETAEGIIQLANDNAAYAISLVSVQRGYDPRDFTLIAYGGSGPMFAPFIAEELEIKRIVVPAIPPGVFSAWGMLNSDIRHSKILTNILVLDPTNILRINETFEKLEDDIREVFRSEGVSEPITMERYADMRYYGQEHTVKVQAMKKMDEEGIRTLKESFHQTHEREYAFKMLEDPVEIVNFQVVGIKRMPKLRLKELPGTSSKAEDALITYRHVYMKGDREKTPIYDRTKLGSGVNLEGPLIMEDPTSTIIVLHGQSASLDAFGNIIIGRKAK